MSWSVSRDGDLITVVEPDGSSVEADTGELDLIHVTINDNGPNGMRRWFVFEDAGEIILCAFPQGASGEGAVIDWMKALPGFSADAFARAIQSTQAGDVAVWRRPA